MSESVEHNAYTATSPKTHVISEALGVPYDASDRDEPSLRAAIDWLVAEVRKSLAADDLLTVATTITRLEALAGEPDDLDDEAMAKLAEDVYFLRAILTDRPAALVLAANRTFLETVSIPDHDAHLKMDHAIATEQLSFATIVRDPARIGGVLAAADNFRRRYRAVYLAQHATYWEAMARISARLQEGRPRARALARLNTLTELGPAVGEQSIEAIQNLIHEATGCPFTGDPADVIGELATCPGCHLVLGQAPPSEQATELLSRLDRAIERQMSRLSSVAIRELLERSTDPRIERFLRVVQASQLSSLADVLDDQLTNYLRRFLLEARIHALLDPMLDQVERGETPEIADARAKLSEMARLVEQATKAAQRKLPPGNQSGQ